MSTPALALAIAALCALCLAASAAITTWPMPKAEPRSADYSVTVDGVPVDVYTAQSVHGGTYSFCAFDFAGEVAVSVTSQRDLRGAVIRPLSLGIKPAFKDTALTFTLDRPRKLSIEPDGINGPLLIFAGTPETDVPKEGDPNVVYFGPGIHKPEKIILKSDQTLYLAGGAVVKGAVIVENAKNVRIRGRGILDGTDWPWTKGPAGHLLGLGDCTKVTIEGITLRGSFGWTLVPQRCRDVTVRNVKIVNSRVQNDDGINPCNSQDVTIEDCFIRSDDDCIALKGLSWLKGEPQPVRNINIRNCVFWCDRARIFLMGHESVAPAMDKITVRDCDIVHYVMTPFLLEPGEHMPLTNVLFENIRLEGAGQRDFIVLQPTVNQYMKTKAPGRIQGVVFRNVTVDGPKPVEARVLIKGADADHAVQEVSFEKVMRYGKVLEKGSPGVQIGEHTSEIRFSGVSAK